MVERFRAHDRAGTMRRDPLRDFVLTRIDDHTRVLEIGAGTGRWTIPLARAARHVTALEPTPAMEEMLRANVRRAELANVEIVPATWEDALVGPHDVTVAAHSMYTSPDFEAFARALERHARTACYMELRVPAVDGIIGELTRRIHGRAYDSPNAMIAVNALYSLGVCANLLVEDETKPWTNATLDEAFARAKRHLNLTASAEHDELIRDTLARRLTRADGGYRWPDGMRSALVWWTPGTLERHTRDAEARRSARLGDDAG